MSKLRVLVPSDYYLPGFRGGGPTRTISNLVGHLGDEFDFHIITRDRDLGEHQPYAGIELGRWTRIGKANVCYLDAARLSVSLWKKLLTETPHDILYLNSLFSWPFAVQPLLVRYFGLAPSTALLVAPRGSCSPGALSHKALKKRLFLMASKALGLYDGALWQASSAYEQADISRVLAHSGQTAVAPDLPEPFSTAAHTLSVTAKERGALRLFFISRIVRMKNLIGALKLLAEVRGRVEFHIYGPIEDRAYWAECEAFIAELPLNIRVCYCGVLQHDQVAEMMRQYHLLFLPSLGENFGHVILEALTAGCPVLISDRTPWRNLSAQFAGWDIALDTPDEFRAVLQNCVDMDSETLRKWSAGALSFASAWISDQSAVNENRNILVRCAHGLGPV